MHKFEKCWGTLESTRIELGAYKLRADGGGTYQYIDGYMTASAYDLTQAYAMRMQLTLQPIISLGGCTERKSICQAQDISPLPADVDMVHR